MTLINTNGIIIGGGPGGGSGTSKPIVGTANQIVVTETDAEIKLSTPQDLGTASQPTFSGVKLISAPSASTDAVTKAYVDAIKTDNEIDFYAITYLTTINGWSGAISCTRRNGIVTLAINDTKKATVDGSVICRLPSWAFPYSSDSSLFFPMFSTVSPPNHGSLVVSYNGDVYLFSPSTSLSNIALRSTATYVGRTL